MPEIVVIGSVNEDISMSVDELVAKGETISSKKVHINNGGKGANQAVAAKRLGVNVSLIAAVGDDVSGHRMIADFKKDQINTQGISIKKDQTGFAVINVDSHGSNSIVVHPGANYALTKADIDRNIDLIKQADYCLLQFEIPMEIIEYILLKCKEYKVNVILNPAPYKKSFNLDYLKYLDYFVPNEHEFANVIGIDDDLIFLNNVELMYLAKKFVKNYSCNLIITLGKRGSLYCTAHDSGFIETVTVNAVDTTGAGDTFIGALANKLAHGLNLKSSMEYASRAAALTVSRTGAQNSIPYKSEL